MTAAGRNSGCDILFAFLRWGYPTTQIVTRKSVTIWVVWATPPLHTRAAYSCVSNQGLCRTPVLTREPAHDQVDAGRVDTGGREPGRPQLPDVRADGGGGQRAVSHARAQDGAGVGVDLAVRHGVHEAAQREGEAPDAREEVEDAHRWLVWRTSERAALWQRSSGCGR